MFCWQCGKKFNRDKDDKDIFVTIRDAIGNELKVHKVCLKDAVKVAGPDHQIKVSEGETDVKNS